MKTISRTVLCLLLFSILLAAASCTQGEDGDETTPVKSDSSQTIDTTTGEEAATDPNGYILDNLPADLDLGGATYNILYWSDSEHTEFYVDGITGEPVDDAIFNRNITVESRLSCKLNFIGERGDTNNINNFVAKVQNVINSGDKSYQIIGTYSRTAATLAVKGMLQNLLGLEYLDLEAPWWPDSLIDEATINDKLFFVSGDISTNMLHMMYAVFFNKDTIIDRNLESPYDLVLDGKWTLPKMMEMASGLYEDLNGNGVKEDTDKFGFMTSRLHIDPFYFTAGLRTTERDAEGNMIVSDDFFSEIHQDVVKIISDCVHHSNDGFYTTASSGVSAQKAFAEGRVLFICDRARTAFYVEGIERIDFGVIPTPKYNEAQENYITTLGFPFSLYCIPIDNENPEDASIILECLASESYRQVTPALFETTMKVKYASDETTSRMYDIIRSTVSFDLGRIYYDSLSNYTVSVFRDNIANGGENFGSMKKTVIQVLEKLLEKVNEAYK